ncbi:unnamed protein product [Agarophyton chilense]
MSETERHQKYIFTGIFSTPERVRARFNAFYQARRIADLSANGKASKADFERYAAQFPEEGAKIKKLHDYTMFTGIGTGLGFVGSTVQMMRMTKTVPLILTGVFVSTVSAHLVADDIGSWILGTYKFDCGRASEKFHEWIYTTKNEESD